jgi:HEAT repeat protein
LGVLRDEDVAGRTITGGPSLDELHRQDFWREEREEQFPPGIEPPALDEAAGRLGGDDALDAMVRLYLAGDRALPLLRPLLEAEDQRAYEQAALLLGLLGDPAAVPALLEFLQQRNTRRFEYTLPQASSRPSVPLYWSAAILLGRFGEPRAVPAMLDLLKLPPLPAQYHAFRRTAYGDDMFRSTDECPPSLASFLIVALGRIGDARATEGVRPYLAVSSPIDINEENKDFEIAWGVQTNAAWALSRMGDNSGVPVLIELLEADQALVRDYAQRLLENMTGKRLGRQRSAWEHWWQSADSE